jgi:hypothetical protein
MISCLANARRRYAKYDAPLQKQHESKSDDPFIDEYDILNAQVEALAKVRGTLHSLARAWRRAPPKRQQGPSALSSLVPPAPSRHWPRDAAKMATSPCLLQQAAENAEEPNRAIVAARNAEIRWAARHGSREHFAPFVSAVRV